MSADKNRNKTFIPAAFLICFILIFSAVLPPAAAACHVIASHGHYRADSSCSSCVKIASMFSVSDRMSFQAVSAFALFFSLLPEFLFFSGAENSFKNTFISSKVRLNL